MDCTGLWVIGSNKNLASTLNAQQIASKGVRSDLARGGGGVKKTKKTLRENNDNDNNKDESSIGAEIIGKH